MDGEPSSIGPYRVTAKLGEGGMGEVYRARDTRLDRDVAIKILQRTFAGDPDRLRRFEREAKALAALNHPNIAHIYGIENVGGSYALVMELVEGPTLEERLQSAPTGLALEEAVGVGRQIVDAIEAAHQAGVVHRDLKPANIKIRNDGTVKVLDFGLAKTAPLEGSPAASTSPTFTSPAATVAGTLMGTPAYMSPEQARGMPVDTRADIWAFGCVMYHMLTGRSPFPGDTVTDVIAAVVKSDPDFAILRAPQRLRLLIGRCLRKDPRQRLRDIGDARLELAEPLETDEPRAPAPARRKSPAGSALVGLALLTTGIATGVVWQRLRGPAPPVEWVGTRLGGPAIVLNPRISPDGQLLAFATIVDGLTQIAVMKPASGNWTVLTRDRAHGLSFTISWSPDSSRIYYDRTRDVPVGIYSVPALGGDERLVIESAAAPEPLPDGSLALLKINADRQPQLHRFWPSNGRLEALPAVLPVVEAESQLRQLPGGHRLVFLGRPTAGAERTPGLYEIDLETKAIRRFGRLPVPVVGPGLAPTLTVGPDGSVLVAVRDGSLYRVFSIEGASAAARAVLMFPLQPRIDAGLNGDIYLTLQKRPVEILRLGRTPGAVERFATGPGIAPEGLAPLADGRLLLPSRAGDRSRVLVLSPGKEPMPLVETDEDTRYPMTAVGDRHAAVVIGEETAADIAIIATDSGRIVHRFRAPAQLTSLGASPDGTTLYLSAAGTISAVPRSGGAARSIGPGDSLTVDPQSGDVIAKLNSADGFRLVRIPAGGGAPRPIPFSSEFGLIFKPLVPGAVWKDQLALPLSAADSWNWHAGMLDLRTGKVTRLAPDYQTDFWYLTRLAGGGSPVATGLAIETTLWKFTARMPAAQSSAGPAER